MKRPRPRRPLANERRRTGCEEALSRYSFSTLSLPFSFSLPLLTAAILYFDVSAENSDYEVSSADGKARSFAQREEKRGRGRLRAREQSDSRDFRPTETHSSSLRSLRKTFASPRSNPPLPLSLLSPLLSLYFFFAPLPLFGLLSFSVFRATR